MVVESNDRTERAKARAQWPVRRFALGREPADDLSEVTEPEDRIAMMWPLAREAWLVAGREIPDYDRKDAPTRLLRPDGSE